MNIWDVLIIIAVVALVAVAVVSIVKNKKQGKSCCSGDCSRCGCDCKITQNSEKEAD